MHVQTSSFNPPLRRGVHPTKVPPPFVVPPPLKHETQVLEDGKTVLEKDIAIPMRDGIKLYANVYRPTDEVAQQTPSVVLFSPFGKHGAVPTKIIDNMGVDFSTHSKYTLWELPDPLVWCAEHHYSLVLVDARGTWWSEGETAYYFSPEEGRDGYDIVEWVAQQSWNTGKVGWGAVSYFAMSAYQVAALQPPHLSAIMLWEGMSDIYRETNVVGGIPGVPFQHFWMNLTGNGLGTNEDHAVMALDQPLFTPLWASKVADWTKINVPAFSITGWSSLAIHLRGTIAAWKTFTSKDKYLWVHDHREWEAFYSGEGQIRQKAFWDRYLKEHSTEVGGWKPVELKVRQDAENSIIRFTKSWPPPESRLVAFSLGGDGKLLLGEAPQGTEPSSVTYVSHHRDSSAQWNHTFTSRVEITGNSSLKLYVQAIEYPDTDLFVAIQKISRDGKQVLWWNLSQVREASAAHGWLRLSHREKDEANSTPGRPVHAHQRRLFVQPSDIVSVEVEIWPSSTIWEAGETLRVVVQGRTFFDDEKSAQTRLANSHSFGKVNLWFGGDYDSHLLVPVVQED